MSNFFSLLGENLKSYPQIKISKTAELFVQNAVLTRLGMSNLNALRDRYEGQSFLDKHQSRLFANLALREHHGEVIRRTSFKLIDDEENCFSINGKSYDIIVCQFGELPVIKSPKAFNNPNILVYQRDIFWMYIIGIIDLDVLQDDRSYIKRSNLYQFQSFDKIKRL